MAYERIIHTYSVSVQHAGIVAAAQAATFTEASRAAIIQYASNRKSDEADVDIIKHLVSSLNRARRGLHDWGGTARVSEGRSFAQVVRM